MILYTIMPLDLVFADPDATTKSQAVESTYLGKQIMSMMDSSGSRKIVRLISTDPQDYLDPRFFPGTVIQG